MYMMHFVIIWKAHCKATTAEGLHSLNITNNNTNNHMQGIQSTGN